MKNKLFFKISKKYFNYNLNKIAVMFPGQGYQYVGMLNEFANDEKFKEKIALCDKILFKYIKANLSDLMTLKENDSDSENKNKRNLLNLTKIAQPAILLYSILHYEKFLENNKAKIEYLFGPSLGEIIALVASDSIVFEDSIKLVYMRGKFMEESCPLGEGAMLNIVGDIDTTIELFNKFKTLNGDGDLINISSINNKRLIVASGKTALIDKLNVFMRDNKIACRRLPVSAAFHSNLMIQGQAQFEKYLKEESVNFSAPKVKIISTIEPVILNDTVIKDLLVKQFTKQVDLLHGIKQIHKENIEIYELVKRKFIDINEYI